MLIYNVGPIKNINSNNNPDNLILSSLSIFIPFEIPLTTDNVAIKVIATINPICTDPDIGILNTEFNPAFICLAPNPSDVDNPNNTLRTAQYQ